MAKVEGLNRRGGRYSVRIIIPADLREVYGKQRVNLALGTGDRREAILLATIKRAEWGADFKERRAALNPTSVGAVSHELARLLADRVRARVLEADDELRSNLPVLAHWVHARKEARRQYMHPLRIPQWDLPEPRKDDLTGATDEERRELAEWNAYLDGQAAIALAGGNVGAVFGLIREEAAKLGIAFSIETPGARPALVSALRAYRTAHREATLRDAGEPIDTPVVLTEHPVIQPKAKPRMLRDVFDRWRRSGDTDKSQDSVAASERALRQFEEQYPALPLTAITRDTGDAYRTFLRGQAGLSSKTQRDRLTALKSLLKFAAETLEWVPKSPWRSLDIKTKTEHPRRAWTTEELQALFSSPLHTMYALPEARNAGREAAYWIPLLGLYTGARLGELCQLRTADVQVVGGIHVLVLTDEGAGQSIKSDAGHRTVPIHSDLVRLGFLRYVNAMREAKTAALWPALPLREGKPSDYFGRWFREHRHAQGLTEAKPDFHCLRHTVRPLMRRAGFSEATQDKVTGHKTKGSIGTVVYDHHTLEEVRAAVEAIRHEALGLPEVAP